MKLHSVFLISCLLLPGLSSADFLNGSFETPTLADGTSMGASGSSVPDWTITNGGGVLNTNQFVGGGVAWNPTPDGNQYLYLNGFVEGGVVLSQTINVTAGANTLDFLQADFASAFGTPGGNVLVSVLDSSNDVVVAPTLFTTPSFSGFIAQTLNFNVNTTGNYTFDFTSVTNHATILDGITLAPEPMSFVALGLGVLVVRRKIARR
jgi:hypothetical protein